MKKKRDSSKSIIFAGLLAIIIVTVCMFNENSIANKYYKYSINKKYSNPSINEYYVDDNFNYVENYNGTSIKNENDLKNYIYFVLNSGINHSERYIDKNYLNYSVDLNNILENNGFKFKELVSIFNNFVHPYNSSNNIKLLYGNGYTLEVNIDRVYTDSEIGEINKVVDKVISEKINENMPIKEKIKIIHDYIIDNTEYDKLKINNTNDKTYKSQTAYGALINGYATCNGYSDAMAIFLNKLNVINYKISNNDHIWNLVYLDGKWYHLDLTWDDPISDTNINRDTYFLISTDELEKINDNTHKFDKRIYSEAL